MDGMEKDNILLLRAALGRYGLLVFFDKAWKGFGPQKLARETLPASEAAIIMTLKSILKLPE